MQPGMMTRSVIATSVLFVAALAVQPDVRSLHGISQHSAVAPQLPPFRPETCGTVGRALAEVEGLAKSGSRSMLPATLISSVKSLVDLDGQGGARARKLLHEANVILRSQPANVSSRLQALHAPASLVSRISSLVWDESSLVLDTLFQSAADRSDSDVTTEFLRSLKLCAPCNNFERWGGAYDGGYIGCTDSMANSGLVAAYSYGIAGTDGWGMDMAHLYGLPTYEYDCYNRNAPHPCPGCQVHFFPECIKGASEVSYNPAFKTIKQHLAANGHANAAEGTLMLKVDVEGAEWTVFEQEDVETLRKFRSINTELHNLGQQFNHPQYLRAMQNLHRAGFVPAHLHGNNNGGMAWFGQYSVPNLLEVLFVRRPAAGCAQGLPYRIPEDQRCISWNPELPNATLPE